MRFFRPSRLGWIVIGILLLPIVGQILFTLLPGVGSYVVLSGSMTPSLKPGSVVYTHDSSHYESGDAITFVQNGELITHRIVRKTTDGFVTKGDARTYPDSFVVHRDQIRGEVVLSVPLYGYLVHPVFSRSAYLYAIVLGGVLIGSAGYFFIQME
ncbi:signal peptidase I [Haladaptatus paucihalophilus DX253]|uniref:Signal peptidase I n=1 Tax=Haladaptatus paucihalophilus DX253 TaxID=797209 RepID=E7QR10_HALPU|nr:signal peptidase I [Haladaptatus paucihalophilus]EFW93424.1 signal peptidase I [Haladaptatus paucihalophilus DX253]SHK54325.1 signal peptidase I [Haladaptatus paucihalophilus DX253]